MNNNNLHPLQSPLWGEFRQKTGVKTVTANNYLITIHPIPYTKYTVGYFPKGPDINKQMLETLSEIGKKENCIFIQIEPNVRKDTKILSEKDIKSKKSKLDISISQYPNIVPSSRPLFTKYTFILDLTKTEDELLKNMHPKTRYNIKLAEKKGVKISEEASNKAFDEYLKLTKETTDRQKFYAHGQNYHKLMWETLKPKNKEQGTRNNVLTAHLLKASYNSETLVAWILFVLGDTLYYPYGASSAKHREVMASNLIMWGAIKFGKRLGLKKFDMWGALGPNPDSKDSWYGFHKFKEGYGGQHVEFIGSYDFVINKNLYQIYKLVNKIRWFLLKFK